MTTYEETVEAYEYLRNYKGTFGFLIDVKRRVDEGTVLSERQVEAVLNSSRREHEKTRRVEEAPEEGVYRDKALTIYKVQRAVHGSGNLYAKRLVIPDDGSKPRFEYAPGAIRNLLPEWKMTLDEAREFGVLYGTCVVCGRTLTDETSISRGIGPVCEAKGRWRGATKEVTV